MNKSRFKNIFLSNIDAKEYTPLYRKVILTNMLLMLLTLIYVFAGTYYMFIKGIYLLGATEFISLSTVLYAIVHLRRTKELRLASKILSINVVVTIFILMLIREGADYTLMWSIFLPISIIFINGSKRGLLVTLIFYIFLFRYAYTGIDIWQDGLWTMASFVRFVSVSMVLTIVIYLFELSLENAFIILQDTRAKEADYIQELETLSITDSLTKLYNRRYLDELFHKNFLKAKKNDDFFVFIILDVDFFKKYNDTYGHQKGDEVLVSVANILKKHMKRKSDTSFRLGGEEFACLIMEKDESHVLEHVEKIRKDIQKDGSVTASFGICMTNHFEYESFDEMYKIADKCLYEAKNSGRNKVVSKLVELQRV